MSRQRGRQKERRVQTSPIGWKGALAAQRAEHELAQRREALWREGDPFGVVWADQPVALLARRLTAKDHMVCFVRCVQSLKPEVWQRLLSECYISDGKLDATTFAEWARTYSLEIIPSHPNWLKRFARTLGRNKTLPPVFLPTFSCPDCGKRHGVGWHWPGAVAGLERDARSLPRTYVQHVRNGADLMRYARTFVPYRMSAAVGDGVEALVRRLVLDQDWREVQDAFGEAGKRKSLEAIRGQANRAARLLGFTVRPRGRQRKINVH